MPAPARQSERTGRTDGGGRTVNDAQWRAEQRARDERDEFAEAERLAGEKRIADSIRRAEAVQLRTG
eukprot:6290478-Lingulodinium_polyedra.AAC.1